MSCPAHELARTRRYLLEEDVDLIRELARTARPCSCFRAGGGPLPLVPHDGLGEHAEGCMRRQQLRVVDVGAGSGTTAAAVFAEEPDADVTTIDISADALNWAGAFVGSLELGPRGRWWPLQRSSLDAAAAWRALRDNPLALADEGKASLTPNLILIDSSHELEQTRAEIAAWLPLLAPWGLMWFHDYVEDGVRIAVDEALAAGKLIEIARRGLGWAGRMPLGGWAERRPEPEISR